jgi:hypothetical protein
MLSMAGIRDLDAVLEPSAGDGAIADAIRERYEIEPACIEYNYSLLELLGAKGHTIIGHDFLTYHGGGWNAIVMNPPFENKQDIDHVKHAFDLLIDGGRLVSVMSASVMHNSDKKATAFREFVDDHGYFQELPEGSFKESGTNVNAVLCVLDK